MTKQQNCRVHNRMVVLWVTPLSTSPNSEHGNSRMSIHPIFLPFASWISVCQLFKIDCQRFFRIGGLSKKLDLRNIKQNTAAMPIEGGETNNLQIGIDIRAVVDDLQSFSKQRGAFVASQPLGIHIGKQVAKGVPDPFFQRHFFQLRQGGIAVPKYPVDGAALAVENHLYIRKCKGNIEYIEAQNKKIVFFLQNASNLKPPRL